MTSNYKVWLPKAKATLEIDWDQMPSQCQSYIIDYGLKQALKDVYAQKCADAKENGDSDARIGEIALQVAKQRLADFMAGKLPKSGGGGAALSLAEKIAREYAIDLLVSLGYKKATATEFSSKLGGLTAYLFGSVLKNHPQLDEAGALARANKATKGQVDQVTFFVNAEAKRRQETKLPTIELDLDDDDETETETETET